ncbi:TetR family transcriptional regulator [Pseudomonas sp. GW456-L14]|nr:TetR family transcriptional regulator [Pseudomonas sp. GW456-L14]PMY51371.1 TetR family transcriptional regulator [Pseudomonas sp. GW456-L12]
MAGVRQFDEEKVLSAVLEVFWRKGWQSTSMADLAEAAEVQRGSLYHAYGGKEALFLLAFEAYATRFLGNAAKALEAADAETALRRFFQVAISNMTSGTPAKGCLTTKTATDADTIGPRIQQRLRELLDALQLTISTALSAERIRGDLVLAPNEAAQVMVTFTRGLAVMERIYQEPERLRSTADSLVRMLVPSVQARA